ncbi:MAG: SH3 domain-containing protein, partial [Chloroflexota bacterium]
TAAGPGWVDLQFTLPRGDFRNVPTLAPTFGALPSLPTPVSIGLPGTASANPIAGVSQTAIQSSTIAIINVTSVNLRTQPVQEGPVIGIVFRYVGDAIYSVVGYAYDTIGTPWVAIVVPGLGTGWVEAPKVIIEAGTPPGTSTTTTAVTTSTVGTIPIPQLEVPHIVVNTSYQNIRTGPGPQYTILLNVPGGTQLEVIGVTTDASWYLVKGTFGQGWIAGEFVLFRGAFKNVPVIHSVY